MRNTPKSFVTVGTLKKAGLSDETIERLHHAATMSPKGVPRKMQNISFHFVLSDLINEKRSIPDFYEGLDEVVDKFKDEFMSQLESTYKKYKENVGTIWVDGKEHMQIRYDYIPTFYEKFWARVAK
jgi:hypothetical protein